MQARDQACRSAISIKYDLNANISEEESRRLEFVDGVNIARMQEIIARFGWPGRSLVGEEGANASLLIVLHADRNVPFQRECLQLLCKAVSDYEAPDRHLAFLTDRILVNEGKPQRYGTQLKISDGQFVYAEMEDIIHVNVRRQAPGLKPLLQ